MSDLTLTPMTELDAVNIMLQSVGQRPVNTLEGVTIQSVSLAKLWLNDMLRTILSDGWSWNREYKVQLTPDTNGNIAVPTDVLSIESWDGHQRHTTMKKNPAASDAIQIYDRDNKTFVFPVALGPYYFDIVYMRDFEELPQAARKYITVRAGQMFQAKNVSSATLFQFDNVMLDQALLPLTRAEQRAKASNLFQGNPNSRRNWNRSN